MDTAQARGGWDKVCAVVGATVRPAMIALRILLVKHTHPRDE